MEEELTMSPCTISDKLFNHHTGGVEEQFFNIPGVEDMEQLKSPGAEDESCLLHQLVECRAIFAIIRNPLRNE